VQEVLWHFDGHDAFACRASGQHATNTLGTALQNVGFGQIHSQRFDDRLHCENLRHPDLQPLRGEVGQIIAGEQRGGIDADQCLCRMPSAGISKTASPAKALLGSARLTGMTNIMADPRLGPASADNAAIASRLQEYAELLEQQGDDRFRVRAFQEAADYILSLRQPLREVFVRDGVAGLIALPKIGRGIAAAVAEMLTLGRWSQLDRLRGDASPARLFMSIPGIGPELARKLTDDAELETLEELEVALQPNGPKIPGIGRRRRQAILSQLRERLGQIRAAARGPSSLVAQPPVQMLLDADALYRDRAAMGKLRTIAPRRFNPDGKAWLPILHARRDDWHLTLMWSNTALARQLGKTMDWVAVYFHQDGHPDGRCTIVTETRGPMAGRRVVRGREAECSALPAAAPATAQPGSSPTQQARKDSRA
jgi:hypothetical protein